MICKRECALLDHIIEAEAEANCKHPASLDFNLGLQHCFELPIHRYWLRYPDNMPPLNHIAFLASASVHSSPPLHLSTPFSHVLTPSPLLSSLLGSRTNTTAPLDACTTERGIFLSELSRSAVRLHGAAEEREDKQLSFSLCRVERGVRKG